MDESNNGTTKRGRGGPQPGSGRPRMAESEKAISKSITLSPQEWRDLAAHAERVGARTPAIFAAQIIRQYLHAQAGKLKA